MRRHLHLQQDVWPWCRRATGVTSTLSSSCVLSARRRFSGTCRHGAGACSSEQHLARYPTARTEGHGWWLCACNASSWNLHAAGWAAPAWWRYGKGHACKRGDLKHACQPMASSLQPRLWLTWAATNREAEQRYPQVHTDLGLRLKWPCLAHGWAHQPRAARGDAAHCRMIRRPQTVIGKPLVYTYIGCWRLTTHGPLSSPACCIPARLCSWCAQPTMAIPTPGPSQWLPLTNPGIALHPPLFTV